VLELSGLTRRFGDLTALDGVSFSVAPGQMFGFVGPNGAARPRRCASCSACSRPTPARSAGAGGRSTPPCGARFGYMPEERGLYPKMRVRDQLVYFARLHGLSAAAAVAAADRSPRGSQRRGAPHGAAISCRAGARARLTTPTAAALDQPPGDAARARPR
jgi:ABC-2 type transport system ATP-binding protein